MARLPVFVSLTTISSRLGTIPRVLEALIQQDISPNRIILNVSSEPFMLDRGVSFPELPEEIRQLVMQGVIELYRVPNTGPYRKLLPTLQRFCSEDFLVATADDDVIYPSGWLAGLVNAYAANGCVVAYRSRLMKFDGANLLSYKHWPVVDWTSHLDKALSIVPTGRNGVLYSSSFFRSARLLNELRLLAPGQDDLAFRIAALAQRIPIATASLPTSSPRTEDFAGLHNSENLFRQNQEPDGELTVNDVVWNNLINYCVKRNIGTDILPGFVIREPVDAG